MLTIITDNYKGSRCYEIRFSHIRVHFAIMHVVINGNLPNLLSVNCLQKLSEQQKDYRVNTTEKVLRIGGGRVTFELWLVKA